ncbi:metallophosphoesterase family protein [Marinilabilia rubra]|uniref:Metallophosphoesterase n=1 Tax=Marinilabilia rubra TaxID=2162893 RepID=A0A2U2BBW3_9BACT|nr:metallophosphoesterase [Marinilabilia rubra]PWE00556.1 metallophosphoesterase [Marinilabilia rubra]
MKKFLLSIFVTLVLISIVSSCENLIEYSPYQAGVGSYGKQGNLQSIRGLENGSHAEFKPFKIALIGDSHTFYDDFQLQIKALNKMDSIDFVVHNGDITLSGIYREFVWFEDITKDLNHPLITLIGNHDFLSNGEYIYKDMFGPFNFTLDYNNCRFVFFDDTIWEKNVEDPDFKWLKNACSVGDDITHIFVFAHIPPWSKQFSVGNHYLYNKIIEDQNVSLSVHGHTHSYFYGKREDSDVPFLVTGDTEDRQIVVLDVQADTLMVSRESF